MPVANTLGPVGKGLSVILSNFNHERWMVTASSVGSQRVVVEECLKYVVNPSVVSLSTDQALPRWASQRIVFGKPLTAQPVIRAKLAAMIQRIEACQNWLESVTHQMNNVCSETLLSSYVRRAHGASFRCHTTRCQANLQGRSDCSSSSSRRVVERPPRVSCRARIRQTDREY